MRRADKYLLDRIQKGLMRLREDGEVEHYHEHHKKWVLKASEKGKRRRYFFRMPDTTCIGEPYITFSVQANRLVWMLVHKREIPDDTVVDHIDLNRYNDAPDNLELMKVRDSHRQGYDIQQGLAAEKAERWFEFVGQHGREPVSEHEFLYVETGF